MTITEANQNKNAETPTTKISLMSITPYTTTLRAATRTIKPCISSRTATPKIVSPSSVSSLPRSSRVLTVKLTLVATSIVPMNMLWFNGYPSIQPTMNPLTNATETSSMDTIMNLLIPPIKLR